jgi:hypothetical protein
MSMETWDLLVPAGTSNGGNFASAGRQGDLSGRSVGLFWNGKPGGNVFLEETARELGARFPGLKFTRFWETRPSTMTSYGNSKDDLAYMAQSADLVIAASSD